MNRLSVRSLSLMLFVVSALSLTARSHAQFGASPEQIAAQLALEKTYPKLEITDQFLHLDVPGQTMGQTTGVALNSEGDLFVYSRTNPQGVARGGKAAMLFEFDPNGKFMKEWGPNNYAESFAHAVKVDKENNVWMVDEGSGMVVKFTTEGLPVFWLGRTPEAIDYLETNVEHLEKGFGAGAAKEIHPKGRVGEFNRPTDVTWDSKGDIFVSDGYGNSRVVKISPTGEWLKELGTWGSDQDQFKTPHGIAADAHDNIYVADRGNRRIQVYDSNLNYERTITGVGAPWAVCVSPSQFLFTGDGNGKLYKLSLDGKVLGWAQTGLGHGQSGDLVHSLACPSDDTVYIGSASLWDVQKITIH